MTNEQRRQSNRLRWALRVDAVSSASFGLLGLAIPGRVVDLLDADAHAIELTLRPGELVAFDNRRITIDTLANVYPFCSWSTWRTDLLRHLRTGRLPGPADFLGMRNLELHMHVPYVPLNQVNIGETEVDIASTQPDIEIVSISDTSTIPYPLRLPPNALLTPSEMSTRAETDLTLPEQDAQWDNDDLENL